MPLVWITVSHPGMAESDTIGDMVRLKIIRRAFEMLGWQVRIVTARAVLGPEPAASGNMTSAPSGGVQRARQKPRPAHAVGHAQRRQLPPLNASYDALLDAQPGPRPDLIVDYNFYFNDAAMRWGRARGIPVILNSETLIEDSMQDASHSLLRAAGRRFEQQKYRRADLMWTVSEPLAEKLRALIGGETPAVHVVPNAADLGNAEARCTMALPENALVVGFVGGFSPWYALDKLVTAASRIRADVPDLHLLLVGDGPERARIDAMLADTPAGWYTLAGRVPHAEVPGYLACFDVGVITNHKWWTSPLKLLEYGAQRMAVVAPDLPSITSMASPEAVAFFGHGDFEDFERTLRAVLADRERRASLAVNLHEAVATRYSLDALATTIEQSLRTLNIAARVDASA